MTNALLVDTGTAVYERLATPLARAGVGLLRATSPVDAIEMAEARHPDAVIINLALRGRVGDFAFSMLRFRETTARVPVVFLIDRARWGRRAHDAAADALVPMPWAAERVLSALWRVASSRPGDRRPIGAKGMRRR